MIKILDYTTFSKELTTYTPYQYQLRVAELLFSGKNVILSVPTGAGKTWASVVPFLYAKQNSIEDFPQKMIYSLPLRTLANSIYSDVNDVLHKNSDLELASIQTGEYKNDEHFENDIIFSTIDQTLSSFLCFPLSLSKRQANINAGSLVGSYLVFDEFHLLDPKLSMATTLGMLRILGNLCRFCIMTATLSEKYIQELKTTLNAVVVSINDFPEDEIQISSLKVPEGKEYKKSIEVFEKTINAHDVIVRHKQKTIIICNRVEKAQRLYNDLVQDLEGFQNLQGLNAENIICLHSRFFDEDRKVKEDKLKELFGKNNSENAILISTQVIEAGMDISCDTMHVEISPINSFLQRAGRCARWEGQSGEIYVYDILSLDEKEMIESEEDDPETKQQIRTINNKYLPYDKELCETTFKYLKEISYLNKNIAQQLVDAILTTQEANNYSLIQQDNCNIAKIQESWNNCEKNMYSQTIRDIQSIELAIIDYNQIGHNIFIPYKYQTIGLFKWSFMKWAKDILATNEDVIFVAESNKNSQFIDWDTLDSEGYQLKPINDAYQLKNCYDIVFVDKSVFKYTVGAGLEPGTGNRISPLKPYTKEENQITEYHKDTFIQHNKAIIGCYEKIFKPKLTFTFKQLNAYWGEDIDWDKLIKVMICLHDYGKLNVAWQKPMKKLQELKGNYDPNEVLAHSDFNETTDKEIEKLSGVKNKPPHAGIGAYALIERAKEIIAFNRYEYLSNCISTAILKHHGVDTTTYPDFSISNVDYAQADSLFRANGINVRLIQKARRGHLIDSLPSIVNEWIIYMFFVRILRLCDQEATINFEKYLKQ
ncbi:CRISPR-associated helicase Cas3' [Microbacter margulisiae]|uniref:CRISPR-associated endonuclease/helicase Cas3 n=1 Tax=Microbacter margulisiae TaxID=1350067 RepID=A0A7W5H0W7_9PORP|nr:CRISPR-associated helicase Cas3' [Microbacter margulisiae]MBB3186019.1 CRISPR-associated endonuclease/helicase Cas3 [Microbacter margulisiae]